MPKPVRPKIINMSPAWIGIDPGKKGAIAVLWGRDVQLIPMPETPLALWKTFENIARRGPATGEYAECRFYLERLGLIFTASKDANFKLGKSYGALEQSLLAITSLYGGTVEQVRAADWHKVVGVTPRKKKEPQDKWKMRAVAVAQGLYPRLSVWNGTKAGQLAVADALLIATYGRRTYSP